VGSIVFDVGVKEGEQAAVRKFGVRGFFDVGSGYILICLEVTGSEFT
jgi:hypothetical protein